MITEKKMNQKEVNKMNDEVSIKMNSACNGMACPNPIVEANGIRINSPITLEEMQNATNSNIEGE